MKRDIAAGDTLTFRLSRNRVACQWSAPACRHAHTNYCSPWLCRCWPPHPCLTNRNRVACRWSAPACRHVIPQCTLKARWGSPRRHPVRRPAAGPPLNAACSGECGEYCSGARAMLGHLLRRWPLCWQLEQVGVCRLRGVPPRSSTPNFRFVEGGRPRDCTTGGSARFEKTPLPAECISRRRVIDGATGYSRTLSSSLSVAMSRNICKPWPSHPVGVPPATPKMSMPTNDCYI